MLVREAATARQDWLGLASHLHEARRVRPEPVARLYEGVQVRYARQQALPRLRVQQRPVLHLQRGRLRGWRRVFALLLSLPLCALGCARGRNGDRGEDSRGREFLCDLLEALEEGECARLYDNVLHGHHCRRRQRHLRRGPVRALSVAGRLEDRPAARRQLLVKELDLLSELSDLQRGAGKIASVSQFEATAPVRSRRQTGCGIWQHAPLWPWDLRSR